MTRQTKRNILAISILVIAIGFALFNLLNKPPEKTDPDVDEYVVGTHQSHSSNPDSASSLVGSENTQIPESDPESREVSAQPDDHERSDPPQSALAPSGSPGKQPTVSKPPVKTPVTSKPPAKTPASNKPQQTPLTVNSKPPASNISPPIVKPAESKAPVVTSTPPKVAEPPVVVTPPTPSPTTVIDFANEYRKQNGKSELSNNGAWSSFAAKLAGVASQKGWACNSPLNVEIVVRTGGSQKQIFEALKAAGGSRILSARYLGYGYSGGYAVLVVAGSSYTNAFNSADQKTAIEAWMDNGGEW